MRNNTAIIVGDEGQDGTLLRASLLRQDIEVIGIGKDKLATPHWMRGTLPINFSVLSSEAVLSLVSIVQPREIYYLAAFHSSSEAKEDDWSHQAYDRYHEVHVVGLLNFLSAIRSRSANSRLFYAGSSLVFSGFDGPVQNERTPFSPVGFYGITKAQGILLCRQFRRAHGVFASTGILYNHESLLRKEKFISKKLITAAHRITLGLQKEVLLGHLDAESDWGYAPDFVEAFQTILRLPAPDDFVVASGTSHSVRYFADLVFKEFGLDYKNYVREDPSILGRSFPVKIGDTSKLRSMANWAPSCSFEEMVKNLVREYLMAQ
jgi:GDPmannose 4,6-dehydratase